MEEVHELIRANGRRPSPEEICRALATLLQEAADAKDNQRKRRIQATQKARECRHSRRKR
ncbi:polymorphic toxin type 34 domain-containing protein [Haliangium sp.]